MKKRMNVTKIIGIVLLLVGVAVLVVGAYNFISFNSSTGGKIANKAAGFFGKQTKTVTNSFILMGIGAACAVVGFIVYKKR
jgi:drug/metabolite transporter (DMT)-like permease